MANELIYLGRDGDSVRLALADLEDLTTRTVPVKKVLRTEFNKLRAQGLDLYGYVESDIQVTDDVFVCVGEIGIKVKVSSMYKTAKFETQKIRVFIGGDGKFRCIHPLIMEKVANCRRLVMRQRVREIPNKLLTETNWDGEFEQFYRDFGLSEATKDTVEYLAQYMLAYGLYGVVRDYDTIYFTPASDGFTEANPFKAHIPKLVLDLMNIRNLRFDDATLQIDELHCLGRYIIQMPQEGYVGTLYAGDKTSVQFHWVEVGRIVGSLVTDVGGRNRVGQISSGYIRGIDKYNDKILTDAGIIFLTDCFKGGLDEDSSVIKGDVIIPEDATLTSCFKSLTIEGKVICGKGVKLEDSFNRIKCNGVIMEGDKKDNPWYKATMLRSFLSAEILGDVDIRGIGRLSNVFTGNIAGTVHFNPNLIELSCDCFTSYRNKSFAINSSGDKFKAGLINKEAVLTVNGDRGNFEGIDTAELIWNTKADRLYETVFYRATRLPSNELPTIEVISTGAFLEFRDKAIDFRKFPNLKQIETRAVDGCDNLMVVVLDGKVKLDPSAFIRCPRLSHIFIGDEVTGVTASAFNNISPSINIYYNKNKAVERLGRIPRFTIHPNSKPEDAFSHLEERADMLETASVVATFASLNGIKDYAKAEEKNIAQAVLLSLNETGMYSDLATKYPVTPRCSKSTREVAWVTNASRVKNYQVTEKREELVRLITALTTLTYPHCSEVFAFDKKQGEVTLESDKYAFIRSGFLVSGKQNWAYAVVDKATDTIIHAFTFGGDRDEIEDIAGYLPHAIKSDPCALLRYTEDIELISAWGSSIFTDIVYEKVRAGVGNSWLPFGSFKLANKQGVYGIDLFTGDFVVFPYTMKDGASSRFFYKDEILYSWWTGRLATKGVKCVGDTTKLEPLLAGVGDEPLARINRHSKLKPVSEVDTTKIPIAQDPNQAKTLLSVLRGGKIDETYKSITDLMLSSELFQKDGRLPSTLYFASKSEVGATELTDGRLTLYTFNQLQYMAVEAYDANKAKTQWFTGIAHPDKLENLLTIIINSVSKVVDVKSNAKHYTLLDKYETIEILPLTARLDNNETYGYRSYSRSHRAASKIWLGISKVSFKACLYFQKPDAGTIRSIMFWFNSLSDAYKAASELGFSPFAAITDTNGSRGRMKELNTDVSGRASDAIIFNTTKAIREGRPDGYIMGDDECNQVLFDLACKQPKNI